MEDVPRELNWVDERFKCEVKVAFSLLQAAVDADIKAYNAQSGLQPDYQIGMESHLSSVGFSVCRKSNFAKAVIFTRGADNIEIATDYPSSGEHIKAVPVLTAAGRRKFEVDGEQLEEWQLRRKSLEELFFRKA